MGARACGSGSAEREGVDRFLWVGPGGQTWWGGEKGAKSEPGGPKRRQKGSKNEVRGPKK